MGKVNGIKKICNMEVLIEFKNGKGELWIVTVDTLGYRHYFNASSKKEILERIQEEMRGIL